MTEYKCLLFGLLFTILVSIVQGESDEWELQNLTDDCLDCMCEAASKDCDLSARCSLGYCGPYRIARIYWADSGNLTIPLELDNSHQSREEYEDCTNNYACAKRTVKAYLAKFGQDCNGDGVTDCYDYMMVHFNGGLNCRRPITWLKKYIKCMGKPHIEGYKYFE